MTKNEEPKNRRIDIEEGNYNERIEGNYVQGTNNFLNNTFALFARQGSSEALSSAKHSRIRQALLKQVNSEVEIRINSSLHNRVYIVLDVDQNPEQIELLWASEIKVENKPKVKLDNTDIIDVFDQEDVAGRLLILGQPGSGKTTMLLKLAEELVKRAKDNSTHPVPVLFSLSSWKNDNQNIKDWLVDQLKDKYGVRKDISKQWVENQEIIPLLDGLDELAAERQENCVLKINEFLHPSNWNNPVIVCSRIQEYERYRTLLELNNSLELYPFSPQQVRQYLQNTGHLQFWDSISNDADLSQLAKTPLFLNIIVLSAQEISIQTWQQFKSSEERLSYLFDAYIRRMFKRSYKDEKGKDKKQPEQENTKGWLSWLANRLIEESATEFLIEKMQPDCLKNKVQKIFYNLIVSGIIASLNVGLISEVSFRLFSGLSFWLFVLFVLFGIFVGPSANKIQTIETLTFSLKKFLNWLFYGLIFGLSLGLIFGRFSSLTVWLSLGLFSWLFYGINGQEIENKTKPNQGIKQSVINTIILSAVTSLPAALIIFIIEKNYRHNINHQLLILNLVSGIFVGMFIGISRSGRPVIKHFILRVILWSTGYIPWNYAKFLNYSTNRLFLQRVGGGYRFMHDLLRQHFAKSYTQSSLW